MTVHPLLTLHNEPAAIEKLSEAVTTLRDEPAAIEKLSEDVITLFKAKMWTYGCKLGQIKLK